MMSFCGGVFLRAVSFAAGALPRGINAGARNLLQHYRFPGNVRELDMLFIGR